MGGGEPRRGATRSAATSSAGGGADGGGAKEGGFWRVCGMIGMMLYIVVKFHWKFLHVTLTGIQPNITPQRGNTNPSLARIHFLRTPHQTFWKKGERRLSDSVAGDGHTGCMGIRDTAGAPPDEITNGPE